MNTSIAPDVESSKIMALSGFFIFLMLYSTLAIVMHKLFKFRISGASTIASFFMSLASAIALMLILAYTTNALWPLTFMFTAFITFIIFLKLFEPHDLASLYAKEQRIVNKLEQKALIEDARKQNRMDKLNKKKESIKVQKKANSQNSKDA